MARAERAARRYTRCRVAAVALAKMSRQAQAGGAREVMGLVLGAAQGDEFVVQDSFALPVEATETRVNAMGEAYAYIVQYTDALRRAGSAHAVVGWYHSHPGYGCFLSQVDIDTQAQNQAFQDPFVAIVIDPRATLERGRTELGCFRTDSPTSFYPLDVTYFANAWDAPLLGMLDARTWARTLARASREAALHTDDGGARDSDARDGGARIGGAPPP